MFKFKKESLPLLGFLQATTLVIYLSFISFFFSLGSLFPDKDEAQFFAPIIMLLLFIISAVISASIVLGKAGTLFWEKKYKEAFTLLGYTVGFGFIYFAIALVIFLR